MRHNNEVTKDSRPDKKFVAWYANGIGLVGLGLDSDHLSTLEAATLI